MSDLNRYRSKSSTPTLRSSNPGGKRRSSIATPDDPGESKTPRGSGRVSRMRKFFQRRLSLTRKKDTEKIKNKKEKEKEKQEKQEKDKQEKEKDKQEKLERDKLERSEREKQEKDQEKEKKEKKEKEKEQKELETKESLRSRGISAPITAASSPLQTSLALPSMMPTSLSFSPSTSSKPSTPTIMTRPLTPTQSSNSPQTPTSNVGGSGGSPTVPLAYHRTQASREMGGITTPDKETAWATARTWIHGWNTRNIDEIMSHYSQDVEFWSPTVAKRWGIASGKLVGKAQLREHFEKGLKAPKLRFELIDVLVGVNGMTILYRRENGAFVVDVVELDEHGKGKNIRAYYGAPRV